MMFQPLKAKVDPPNYEFKLESLEVFLPEKKISDLEPKFGKGELVHEINKVRTHKFKLTEKRYIIHVFVQENEGTIYDMFTRLPSYFLHDVFLQSLVNKLGKQTSYKKIGEEAYYTWINKNVKHVYSAACTITCFPIFYAVEPTESKTPTLLLQMRKASLGK